ncbi:MAG: 2-dehydropantoate 2-reductase N-terminal domain-containing protein [Acidimicrobiales bacterium]|nr:2-dehydropantoate 2-reductase N-terminal domain-containing protein [Acidimicrobiales bacterium]
MGPAVADGATVAMFQNGLGVERQVRDAVPHAGAVLGARCFVCCRRVRPGVADHVDYGAVTVGTFEDGAPPVVSVW